MSEENYMPSLVAGFNEYGIYMFEIQIQSVKLYSSRMLSSLKEINEEDKKVLPQLTGTSVADDSSVHSTPLLDNHPPDVMTTEEPIVPGVRSEAISIPGNDDHSTDDEEEEKEEQIPEEGYNKSVNPEEDLLQRLDGRLKVKVLLPDQTEIIIDQNDFVEKLPEYPPSHIASAKEINETEMKDQETIMETEEKSVVYVDEPPIEPEINEFGSDSGFARLISELPEELQEKYYNAKKIPKTIVSMDPEVMQHYVTINPLRFTLIIEREIQFDENDYFSSYRDDDEDHTPPPPPKILGTAEYRLEKKFIVSMANSVVTTELPVSESKHISLPVKNSLDEFIGKLNVFLRISCFGKTMWPTINPPEQIEFVQLDECRKLDYID